MLFSRTFGILCVVVAVYACTSYAETRTGEQEDAAGRVAFEMEWDAYYTSADLIFSLTDKPIPTVEGKTELEVYRNLLKRSFLPRQMLLEASVYPMSCLGGWLKQDEPRLYDDAKIGGFNVIDAITSGFEEPYAFSIFAGNVVQFKRKGEPYRAGNNGYMGFLFSFGNYHIKDNDFIYDKWREIEVKLKGDRIFSDLKLLWSFRLGAKFHHNPEITDSVYVSLRRSRLDYAASASDIFKNSGFEYTFSVAADSFKPISHYLLLEKKWPVKSRKFAFSLGVGMIYELRGKYTGSLSRNKASDFQLFLRPNIEF